MLIASADGLINWAWTHRVHCNQPHFYLQLSISPVNAERGNQTIRKSENRAGGGVGGGGREGSVSISL